MTGMILIDLQKAFDAADRDILFGATQAIALDIQGI